MAKNRPSSVDEYLALVESDAARKALVRLREVIRSAAPEAAEVIKYGIPTYEQCGYIASFAAYKNHCSLFPGHTVNDFSEALKGYKVLRGTVQFSAVKALPEDLVRAMIKARVAENLADSQSKA